MSKLEDEPESNAFGDFDISEDFVQAPTYKQASTTSVDFDGLLQSRPLKLHEDLTNGNGGQAWPAGFVLARYLLRTKRDELKDCSMSVGRNPRSSASLTDARQLTRWRGHTVSSWVRVVDLSGKMALTESTCAGLVSCSSPDTFSLIS